MGVVKGTRWFFSPSSQVFMRVAGTLHRSSSKSTSSHFMPEIAPTLRPHMKVRRHAPRVEICPLGSLRSKTSQNPGSCSKNR